MNLKKLVTLLSMEKKVFSFQCDYNVIAKFSVIIKKKLYDM